MKNFDEKRMHKVFYKEIFSVFENEPYANHLGIQLEEMGEGTASASMAIREFMLNSHDTVHGAVLYALADYVFAAASNSYGKTAVGLTTTMNFMAPAKEGDRIRAKAVEEKRNQRIAWYKIQVFNGEELIATMEAAGYRKSQYFVPMEELEGEDKKSK
ncbi:hotdog fold thioesterase [Siminovitchia sediminis]|uniref:Hotdog fold thioesterase n=1 Tax=Siminovitchia sediminis TaxID=1274353 RepID=A0ABW4KGN3_9BACI